MKKIAEITFVKEDEREKVLKERGINIPEDATCIECGCPISTGNLGIIIPKDDTYVFVCSKEMCMILAKLEI